jgi:hypothetical protein
MSARTATAPRLTTVATVTGTEEGRAFYQRRLAGCALCMFLLTGGSWLVLALAHLLAPRSAAYDPLRQGTLHLGAALLCGLVWLATRTGRRAGRSLHVLDISGSMGTLLMLTVGASRMPVPIVAGFINLLCFTTVMMARAIVVPSTARRTFLLALAGGLPVVALAAWRAGAGAAVGGACWVSSAIVLATVASHTIFGLRREIQQARVLGQYTLESKIGEGGMGEVWRASHALLRRPTAVKLLPPGRTGEAAIRRFEREVQITARLTHPSTVAIYDYGRTREGVFYYAMELLDGTDLERLVAEHGPQPAGRVVHMLMQVCGALAEAHDLGLVHRDIKPANVLLLPRAGEQELAKVVDFGLVKDLQSDGEQAGLTATNTITGTPLYMAPEAIRDPSSISPASDLYALGAVAWFLLVGRPPFVGSTIIEVCGKHLHTPPAPPSTALGAPVPRDVEELVLACLAKDPDARPRTARILRAGLHATGAASSWTEEQAAQWWRQRTPARAAAASSARTIALEVAARALGT